MNKNSKIYIAGHNGMVGSAILRLLISEGYSNIVTESSSKLDLRNQNQVKEFFEKEKPNYVFLAAAKVGGILANSTYKAEFLYDNMMIQNNVIHHSYKYNVRKLLFLGSSCIYPKLAPQPLREEYLLTDSLEPSNEPYAIAKISGIKMCEFYRDQYGCNFISIMPTNLFGPRDNYHLENSHLIPALLRKFYLAKHNNFKSVEIWGDGSPYREFLHVDDCASACLFLMNNYNDSQFVNVGSGVEFSIKEVAELIQDKIGFNGELVFNTNYPNGTPRKLMDVSRINNMGWKSNITLEEGIDRLLPDLESELEKYK
ncbi:MAG: GDP-fucose synthetase [Flavobacteriales bacterium]|nr:GDP-fucose synthetase [Flavobacteriales bacterium]